MWTWTREEKAQSLKTIENLYSLISSLDPLVVGAAAVDYSTSFFPFYVHPEKQEVRFGVDNRDFYEDCYCIRAKKEYEGGYFVERDPYYPLFNIVRVSLDDAADETLTRDLDPPFVSIGSLHMWTMENRDLIPYAGSAFPPGGPYLDFQRIESFVRVVIQTIFDAAKP